MSSQKQRSQIDELASQCVKCGLCLPHCPTYAITQDENESPRGRIALMQAIAQDQLQATEVVQKHLSLCLTCRACERVCPSHVQYGSLIDKTRDLIKKLDKKPDPLALRLLSKSIQFPTLLNLGNYFLYGLEIAGFRQLARKLGITKLLGLNALDELLPPVQRPIYLKNLYLPKTKQPTAQKSSPTVALFTGCLTKFCDSQTLQAAIFVLQRLGYQVFVPKKQTCCGALALHAGEKKLAKHLAQQNVQAFTQNLPQGVEKIEAIVSLASGCGSVLLEYDQIFSLSSNSNFNINYSAISKKIIDISQFIMQSPWPTDLKFTPLLNTRLALHTPCTLRNVLKSNTWPEKLLTKLPGINWQPLTPSEHCCGSAGSYMLTHSDMADALLENILKELDDIQANFIATSNIGCALHFKKRLRKRQLATSVIHPITIFARTLGFQ